MRAIAVMLMLVLPGCNDRGPSRVEVAADSAQGEIAFELQGPGGVALMVPVHVNGSGPFDFILDTGATVTCVDRSIARDLSLRDVPGAVGTGAGVGSEGRLQLVEIDSLRIGGAIAFDLQGCVVDLQHLESMDLDVDGLVGLNFLSEFHVTLDFDRRILRLRTSDAADSQSGQR